MRGGLKRPRYEIDPFEAARRDAEQKQKEVTDNAVRDPQKTEEEEA